MALRLVAEKAPIGASYRSVGRLDMTVQEGAFAHVDGPGGIRAERRNDVMSVVVVKPAQYPLTFVGAIVAVGIFQEDEIIALGHIDAFVAEFEARG